jgi:Holliday junction resolvase RusA-like endonuclease
VAKGRPRFTSDGRAYTPRATRLYENLVRQSAWAHGVFRHLTPDDRDWCIDITIYTGNHKHGDGTNILKAIEDGLNRRGVWDDRQLRSAHWTLYPHLVNTNEERVEVRLWRGRAWGETE